MNGAEAKSSCLSSDAAEVARQLGKGRLIALAGILALALTFLFWPMDEPIRQTALLSALLLGLLQGYFAIRVHFDFCVFRNWSSRWRTGADPATDLAEFDARIGRPARRTGTLSEDLALRSAGARRLLKLQAASAATQLLMLAIALWP